MLAYGNVKSFYTKTNYEEIGRFLLLWYVPNISLAQRSLFIFSYEFRWFFWGIKTTISQYKYPDVK